MTLDTETHVTIIQAAKIAGRHPGTVQRWISYGKLPATLLGHVWFIKRTDLDSYLQTLGE